MAFFRPPPLTHRNSGDFHVTAVDLCGPGVQSLLGQRRQDVGPDVLPAPLVPAIAHGGRRAILGRHAGRARAVVPNVDGR